MRKKKDSHRHKVCFKAARVVRSYQASIQPKSVGSNQQPAPLTDYGSVCRQSWSQYKYLLLCRTRCILYQLPPLLLATFWILWCRHTDNPSGRNHIHTIGVPTSTIHPFLCQIPLLPQPSQLILAWDRHRIMLACTPVLPQTTVPQMYHTDSQHNKYATFMARYC